MKCSTLLALLAAFSLTLTQVHAQQKGGSLFDSWDKDGNQKLSREELPERLRPNFDRVDTDKDGFISRKEDADFRSGNRPQAQAKGKGKGRQPRLPEGVKKMADIDYVGDGNERHLLDLYLPERPKGEAPLPLVVWIHGGGWQNGSKENSKFIPQLVATGEFAGASINYRLTDQGPWPIQIHDCKAAIRWLKAHAEEYNYDANRIAVAGSSAGGHLVAMMGVSDGVEELEGTLGDYTDQNGGINCVVDFYGPTDFPNMNNQGSTMNHDAADSPEGKLVGGKVSENLETAKNASPLYHVTDDDEPFMIIHGTKDPLVPIQQSIDFEKALEEKGVSAIFITVDEGGHGKGFGPDVNELAIQYIRNQLLGEKVEIQEQTVKAVTPQ